MLTTLIKIARGTYVPEGTAESPTSEERLKTKVVYNRNLTCKTTYLFSPSFYFRIFVREFENEYLIYPKEYLVRFFCFTFMFKIRTGLKRINNV